MPQSLLHVDLDAISHNVRVFQEALRGPMGAKRLIGVVKRDAYSLGAVRFARRLVGEGVSDLCVFSPDEARELVEAGVPARLLVLMPVSSIERSDPLYRHAATDRLHLTVHDGAQLEALGTCAARLGLILPLHLEVDTGMTRAGARPERAMDLLERINASPRFRLAGLMTHFSSARNQGLLDAQHELLHRFVHDAGDQIGADVVIHAGATMGVLRHERYHHDGARIGIGLHGYSLAPDDDACEFDLADRAQELRPVLRWTSRIVHVSEAPAGWPVGYRALWRAPQTGARLGVVPVGYADGFPERLASDGQTSRATLRLVERTPEGIVYHDAPVVGRISMDQMTVDLTGAPARIGHVGAEIELVGPDPSAPNHLPTLAAAAGCTTHELLARISPRIGRCSESEAATEARRPTVHVAGRARQRVHAG